MAFLGNNKESKDIKVALLSELPEGLNFNKEFSDKNRRGEYKQIQADFKLDGLLN